ncbi:MAG: phosphodiester glycosidase family protein [Symploca sp. SIO2C1]|nr:phosphodiester glycosidase family protein [Symploca sp. SIO2C1]
MRKVFWLSLLVTSLLFALLLGFRNEVGHTNLSIAKTLPEAEINYQSHQLDSSVVHSLLIPVSSGLVVKTASSEQLISLENFVAQQDQALAVINGGFFDPNNQKTTSYIVQERQLVADPRLNEGLMDNPNNASYLDKILNRTEFRRYSCGSTFRYDIALHSEAIPEDCILVDALGGGPGLLPALTLFQEGFLDFEDGKVIRDALGTKRLNARSAVGITREGDILLVMAAQKPELPQNSGVSLPELAEFMKSFGVEEAMNLDGGSSSALYYQGETFYGKVTRDGDRVKRPIKSVLVVTS